MKNEKFNSGVSSISSMSYEKYLNAGLCVISPHLSVRVYKLANKEDYPMFERGRDIRVQVYWKKESKYEMLIERSFYYQSNTNKEDRQWMRNYADVHLKNLYDSIQKGKKSHNKKKPTRKAKTKVGSTQDAFEKMKSK